MSRELLLAIAEGNLDFVQYRLRTDDINFIGTLPDISSHKVTPLTLSLMLNRDEITVLLINAGAKLENANNKYTEDECYLYGYPLVCFIQGDVNEKIRHMMLDKVTHLNPVTIINGSPCSVIAHVRTVCSQLHGNTKSNFQYSLMNPFKEIYKRLHCSMLHNEILYESLFRNDVLIYDTILSDTTIPSDMKRPKVTKDSLIYYLNHKTLSSNDILTLSDAIFNARKNNLDLADSEILEIFAIIKKKVGIKNVFITDFPVGLWNTFPRQPTTDLNTLASELFNLLFPEDYFTPFHAESAAFKNTWGRKLSDDEISLIKLKQDPVNLRKILDLDYIDVIIRLSKHTSPLRENYNPAVANIAEILLFHCQAMITVNDNEESLLSEAQCSEFVSLLHRFYNTPEAEQLIIRSMNQQTTHKPENYSTPVKSDSELKEKLTRIEERLSLMEERSSRMEEKLDKLTMLLTRQMKFEAQETGKQSNGVLFRPVSDMKLK
jgi:hypothetical protein